MNAGERREIIPYLNWRPGKTWSINLYGVFGLADGSPDTGVGLQLSLYH